MRLILGPFCGEIGWELCYWQAHGRWLKEQTPAIEIYAVTFPGRQALYRDFADCVVFHSNSLLRKFGRLDCYNSDGFDRKRYFSYVGKLIEEFHAYGAITTPNHNGRFYLDPSHMVFSKLEPLPNLAELVGIKEVTGDSIILFPRHRKDSRDWLEKNWEGLVDRLLETDYQIVIAGVKDSSCLTKRTGERIINLTDLGKDSFYTLDLVLYYLSKVKFAIGSQSALPLLALHQRVPTLMWGHEKKRHEGELNYFSTPCRFIEDPGYGSTVNAVFEEFEKLREETEKDAHHNKLHWHGVRG